MPACALKPGDRKALISAVGMDLVRQHGERKYYKPADIRRSAEKAGYSVDFHCGAYCIYSSPEDFKAVHDAVEETCDYAAMKAEVLADLAGGASFSWLHIDFSGVGWAGHAFSPTFCGFF